MFNSCFYQVTRCGLVFRAITLQRFYLTRNTQQTYAHAARTNRHTHTHSLSPSPSTVPRNFRVNICCCRLFDCLQKVHRFLIFFMIRAFLRRVSEWIGIVVHGREFGKRKSFSGRENVEFHSDNSDIYGTDRQEAPHFPKASPFIIFDQMQPTLIINCVVNNQKKSIATCGMVDCEK